MESLERRWLLAASVIIDDGDVGYGNVGSWTTHPAGYQADNRYSAAGGGSDIAEWTFTGLASGVYRVSATWPHYVNRATNSPFTVFDGASPFKSVLVNQQLAPNDFAEAGANWEDLGGYYPISSGMLKVQLTDAANGFVIADAIRIERVGDLPGTPGIGTIVDDGDAGYTNVGEWTTHPAGYLGDNRYSAAGSGNDRAEWQFTGLSSGVYRVSATWPHHVNRATNSPFTVFDGGLPFKTVLVNQEVAPNDFSSTGANWEDLGGLYPITSGTLTVRLTDAANEYVIADAIRIERISGLPATSEIQVTQNGSDIAHGTGTVAFGITPLGSPVSKTFTVHNLGSGDLTLVEPISVPGGFSVTTFGSLVVAPGLSTTFAVQLDAVTEGTFTGQVSFANDDDDENPFNFQVSGTVILPPLFVNDNWHFQTDVAPAGLSLGDILTNANDALAPGTLTVQYGIDGFGVITSGIITGSLPAYDEIQDAIASADPGGEIRVLAGSYNLASSIVISKPLSLLGPQAGVDPRSNQAGTRTAGATATEAVINGGGMATLVRIAANQVTLDGFDFRNGSGDLIESSEIDAIVEPVIRHNFIRESSGDEGIQLRGSTNALIEYNQVYNTRGDGINLSSDFDASTGGVIRYNQVFNIGSDDAAIYVYGATNTEVRGNLVYNVTQNDGIKMGSKLGDDAGLHGGAIIDNVVHDVAQDGIAVYTSGVNVLGNEVYHSSSENGAIFVQFAVDNVTVANNNVHDNAAIGITVGRDFDTPIFVAVKDNKVNRNLVGIYINRATGLIENNDLTANTVGIRIEHGALVDAGSINDPGDGNSNPTGRTVGSDVDGSSIGRNVLTGYTGVNGNFAIQNLNLTAGGHPNVKAENNAFGTSSLTQIEAVIFHRNDNASYTLVDFQPPLSPPTVVFVIDDGDAGFSTTGEWTSHPAGYQGDNRYSKAGIGADLAEWTFTGLASGVYRVSATWPHYVNRATNSPFTVYDGTAAFKTVLVNQQLAPDDFNTAGANWEDLGGFYTIASGTLRVRLTDAANQYVIADAIRVERVADLPGAPGTGLIIDDGAAGYSNVGEWTVHPAGYLGDNRYSAAGTGADRAEWTFTGLASGMYRVSATWPPHVNRATNSPFTVFDGSMSLKTVLVNQELAPNDFTAAGANWEDLGAFYAIASGTLTVRLTDAANEYVIADAIRIERLGDIPPLPVAPVVLPGASVASSLAALSSAPPTLAVAATASVSTTEVVDGSVYPVQSQPIAEDEPIQYLASRLSGVDALFADDELLSDLLLSLET